MTDTPSARTASPDLASDDGSFWGRVDSERARTGFGLAFFLAVAITAAAIWLVAVAPGATSGSARGSSSQIALIVLAANLLLISGLAIIVGRRVLTLVRSTDEAGSRLHLRFVALFSMVALVPSVLIALVFGVLVNRGVDQWFSENVKSSVDNGAIMTGEVETCGPETTLDELMKTMTDRRIRHVPVVTDGKLVGIVSIGDIVKHRIGQLQFERDQLDSYVHQS